MYFQQVQCGLILIRGKNYSQLVLVSSVFEFIKAVPVLVFLFLSFLPRFRTSTSWSCETWCTSKSREPKCGVFLGCFPWLFFSFNRTALKTVLHLQTRSAERSWWMLTAKSLFSLFEKVVNEPLREWAKVLEMRLQEVKWTFRIIGRVALILFGILDIPINHPDESACFHIRSSKVVHPPRFTENPSTTYYKIASIMSVSIIAFWSAKHIGCELRSRSTTAFQLVESAIPKPAASANSSRYHSTMNEAGESRCGNNAM